LERRAGEISRLFPEVVRDLFDGAGFKLGSVIHTPSSMHIVEARPA
jgi:hypothetical protein